MCTNSAKFSVCDGHRARKHTTRAAEWETARGYTKLGAAGGLPAGGSRRLPIGVKDGNEVGGQERGSEGSSPSINNKNNNNGNEEVGMGRRPGRVVCPTYKDMREVLDARERRTDDMSKQDYEAHQRWKEEGRPTLPELRAQIKRRVEDMKGVPI